MNSTDQPLVSVIIPCFNHGHHLPDAINSLLSQKYPALEIIVVDDGSTDSTAEAASHYGDRIRYVYRNNGGLSAARNSGVQVARGDFLHFLDADDYVPAGWYDKIVTAVTAQPSGDVYHGGWCYVDAQGNEQGRIHPIPIQGDPLAALLQGNRFPCHAALVRRSAANRAGLFKEQLRACEDWDFWIRVAAAGGSFISVPESYVIYRRYPGSMSTDHRRMWNAGLEVLGDARAAISGSEHYERAVDLGKAQWRRYCFKRLLQGMQRATWMQRSRKAYEAIRQDPPLLSMFAVEVGRSLARRMPALLA